MSLARIWWTLVVRLRLAVACPALACPALACLAMSALTACSSDTTSHTTPTQPTYSTTTSTPTDEKAIAVLDTLTRAIAALPRTNGLRDSSAMLAIVRRGNGVTNVQVAPDGNVVAVLPTGIPVTFVNNRVVDSTSPQFPALPPDTTQVDAFVGAANSAANVVAPLSTAASLDIDLPTPTNARYSEGMGTVFTEKAFDYAALLRAGKFTNVTSTSSSIELLKNVTNLDLFWISAHGGSALNVTSSFPFVTNLGYGLWTSTKIDLGSLKAYRSLIDNGEVAFMCATQDWVPFTFNLLSTDECHFAILPKFIRTHNWSFREGAVVMLDACSSGSPEAADLRAALFEAGAGSILGWTEMIHTARDVPALALTFDWMLGANFAPPQAAVKYRPFLWTTAKTKLDSLTFTKYSLFTAYKERGVHSDTTELKLFSAPGKYDNLALNTAISGMSVNADNNRLALSGVFGPDPGAGQRRVSIGGRDATVTSWSPFSIEASLTAADGGDVFVETTHLGGAKRSSNIRALTRWTGLVTYTTKRFGVLQDVLTMRPVFRGDVGTYWSGPMGRLKRNTFTYQGVRGYSMQADSGSTCSASTGGTYKVGDVYEETWSQTGSGTVPISKSTQLGCTATLFVPADASGSGGKIAVYAQSARIKLRTVTTTDIDGNKQTNSTQETLVFPMSNVMGGTGVIGPNVQADNLFNMFPGTRTATSGDGNTQWVFTWGPFGATGLAGEGRAR